MVDCIIILVNKFFIDIIKTEAIQICNMDYDRRQVKVIEKSTRLGTSQVKIQEPEKTIPVGASYFLKGNHKGLNRRLT